PEQEPRQEGHDGLRTLGAAIAANPALTGALRARWRRGGAGQNPGGAAPHEAPPPPPLPPEMRAVADRLGETLPLLVSAEQVASIGPLFDEPAAEVLLTWCAASAGRRDVAI